MSKIEVRPIERATWHEKKGKESFKRPVTIMALVDTKTGKYSTGLDYEKPFNVPDNKEKLTEAEYYGKLLGQDLSNNFVVGKIHQFWDNPSYAIKLENNTMVFDTNNPLDYIKIKVLKASKYVANSIKDYNDGLYPLATHVITDENEEVEIKATKVELKKKAVLELNKLPKDRKIHLIHIISGKNLKGKSDSFVEVELDNIIENNVKDLLYYIKLDAKSVKIHSEIIEAIAKNVLRVNSGKIMYKEIELGFDVQDVVDFFSKDVNQELLLRLEQEINK